ncbi:UNVERIFIED_CONTAM: solute carrier family 25 protein, partial [Bacteroidetes bacterium 56_B9]
VYQGVGSVIIATLPSSGAFFTTYEGIKSILTTANQRGNGNGEGSGTYVPAALVHAAACK